jgi:hypothetical protein
MIPSCHDVLRFSDGPPLLVVAVGDGVPFSAEADGSCMAYLRAVPADADASLCRRRYSARPCGS